MEQELVNLLTEFFDLRNVPAPVRPKILAIIAARWDLCETADRIGNVHEIVRDILSGY